MKNKKIISMFLALMILVNGVLSVVFSVSANTEDGIYTEAGETYTSMRAMESTEAFFSQSFSVKVGGTTLTDFAGKFGYVTSQKNTGSRSAMFTVPENGTPLGVTVKSFVNKMTANTKYVQLWFNNKSGNAVYISNLKFVKSGTFQYNLKSGAEVQLIDEKQKTVVNAARWSLVNTGNENGSRAIKIPADFTGYIRIPISADTIDVRVPASSAFDASLFAQATEISFSLGNMGDGGAVYIDDVGYVTGGSAAKAGAKFADLSQEMVYTDPVTGKTMAYRIYVPQNYDFITKYPVVLYLHGNGAQGNDNASHVTGDMGEPLDELVSLGNRGEYPCIIVAPQCPTGEYWVNTTFKNGSYSVDTVAETDAMAMALDILADVQDKYSVDTNRTYAMGVSMGAFGCWDIMVRHPGVLDAAVPMMGAGDPSKAAAIGNTAIWAFHGAKDNVVTLETATPEMVTALQAIDGTNVKYTEYADHAHDTYRFAVCEEELLPWLFSQGDIYVNDLKEEYNVITGFEKTDTATISGGSLTSVQKNTGAKSWTCTPGDNTSAVTMKLTFGETYPLSTAKYVQFWINNTSDKEQYIANLSFQRSGVLQYNVPVGAYSTLIDENTLTETAVQWMTRAVGGLGSALRTLAIPAGFSGYVRISLDKADLAPTSGTYDAEKFDTANVVGFYIGNSSTGDTVYIDDFGYITDLKVEPDVFAKDINLHINSFGADESFSASIGTTSVVTTVKEAGNFAIDIPSGTYFKNPVIGNSNQTSNASAANYLQFTVKNDSTVEQYIFNFNMYIDSAQSVMYRINTNTEVFLIDDATNTIQQVQCKASGVSGASTSIGFSVPAGFSGKVRISLDEAGLEVRKGEYSKTNVGKIRFYNFLVGNRTATASTVIFDDFEFVDVIEELPTVLGAQIRTEDNNLRFVMMHNKAVIEELEAKYKSVEYGTVVVNASAFDRTQELLVTDKTTGFGSGNPTTLANKSAFTPEGYDEFYADYRVYSFVIKGVTGARKDTPIAVRAYIKVTDNEGNEHILYGYDKYKHDGYQTTYNAVLAETEAVLSK